MISSLRLQANRRNALRSTGPRTDEGKQRSRVNALRHGLTAETIVSSLEDAEDYQAFEATIISDYCPETAVARELVLRLASLLWRLRRATAIEAQLLEMQAEESQPDHVPAKTEQLGIQEVLFRSSDAEDPYENDRTRNTLGPTQKEARACDYADATRRLAYCFLRLGEQDAGVLERLNRYEAALWRQAVQIICVLHPIRLR